jgi:acetyl esterase/lipase
LPQLESQQLPESLRQLLAQAAQLNALQRERGFEYTPIGMRENLDLMTRRFVTRIPEVPFFRDTLVREGDNSGFAVPVRIYHPDPARTLPVLVFAHGGGHMAGSVSVYDAIARKLAVAAERVLVSVDYRLAPECPYPSGLDDLKQVILGVFHTLSRLGIAHLPRLAVAGDSGGGAITATAVHQLSGEEGIDIDRQVLIYPSLDYSMSSASVDSLGEGYLLERKRMAWLFDQYFQHAEDRGRASPLFMPLPDQYPETLVVTAGYCPLRDEGLAYVDRLDSAGCKVESLHFPNMIHAFLHLEDLVADECASFYRAFGRFLRGAAGEA